MRITGGRYCGMKIKVPQGERARPTQDRVREALFSILAPRIVDSRFLDLFAGSGAVGLDAVSRGAEKVTWVEQDTLMLRILRENLQKAGIEGRGIMRGSVFSVLPLLAQESYDIIFADPPYARRGTDGLVPEMLAMPSLAAVINDKGLLIIEQRAGEPLREAADWRICDERKYGQTRLVFYIKEKPV